MAGFASESCGSLGLKGLEVLSSATTLHPWEATQPLLPQLLCAHLHLHTPRKTIPNEYDT